MIDGTENTVEITAHDHGVWREGWSRCPERSMEIFVSRSINVSYRNGGEFRVFDGDIHDVVIGGYPNEFRFKGWGDKDGNLGGYINITLPYGLPEGLHVIEIGGSRGGSDFL